MRHTRQRQGAYKIYRIDYRYILLIGFFKRNILVYLLYRQRIDKRTLYRGSGATRLRRGAATDSHEREGDARGCGGREEPTCSWTSRRARCPRRAACRVTAARSSKARAFLASNHVRCAGPLTKSATGPGFPLASQSWRQAAIHAAKCGRWSRMIECRASRIRESRRASRASYSAQALRAVSVAISLDTSASSPGCPSPCSDHDLRK